jgi:hypothetical protein
VRVSDLPGSLQNLSPERSPLRNATERASQQISPTDLHDFRNPRSRAAGQRYIGPILHDDHDTKVEEAEFEKFKMQIRERKIWEFHYAAAKAGVTISRQLCDRTLDKQTIKEILAGHDHEMESLRRTKEDERKSIVDNEREKRQTEFRRRGALHDATAKPWKPFETILDTVSERDPESSNRNVLRPLRNIGPKKVNGVPQSSMQPSEETKIHEEGWHRRAKDDTPIASTSRQLADAVHNTAANSNHTYRVEDLRMPGAFAFEQKKPAVVHHEHAPSKASDQPLSSIPQQSHNPWADAIGIADITEGPRREGSREKEAASTSMKTMDGPSNSKSRRKGLLQQQQGIWRPEGVEGPQDTNGADVRRRPEHKSGASLDNGNTSNRKQPKKEEFWIPGGLEEQDAPTETIKPKLATTSHTKTTGSLQNSKLPQVSAARVPIHDAALRQGRPIERLETKPAPAPTASTSKKMSSATSSSQPSRDPVVMAEETSVGGVSPTTRSLEKQKQNVNNGLTHDLGAETAPAPLDRPRRASDPPPPSPNFFNVSAVQKQTSEGAKDVPKQPKSILKKSDRKAATAAPETNAPPEGKKNGRKGRQQAQKKQNLPPKPPKRPVTLEEVSDEEADPLVRVETKPPKKTEADRPPEPSIIVEPKPSMPASSFSQIFHYSAEEETTPSDAPATASTATTPTAPPDDSRPPDIWYPPEDPATDIEDDDGWNMQRTSKAKHVRWTPSVLSNSSHSSSPDVPADDASMAFRGWGWNPLTDASGVSAQATSSVPVQKAKSRSRASSLMQSFEGAADAVTGERVKNRYDLTREPKGKGKEKVAGPETAEDELSWYAREAIESLKAMRSKPASAV